MKQIEAVTIAGSVSGSGNAVITITANGMTSSPKAINVAVVNGNDASAAAALMRYVLATDSVISGFFLVGGATTTVQLTARNDAANDTTMNIAVANGTCVGLTPVPISSNVQAGVAVINNGYCTLDEFKAYARIDTTSILDDSVLVMFIEAASRYIDKLTNTTFYTVTANRHFDEPFTTTLFFNDYCTAINSITNGDGSPVVAADYVTLPADANYIYAVTLIRNTWKSSPSTSLQCITVNANWGKAATTPADIKECCLLIIKSAYNRRFGENITSTSTVTQAGVVITPEDIPAKAREIINQNRKVVA